MSTDNYTPDLPTKQCSKCKVSYPATPEYFARAKNRKDGLYQQCKICHRAGSRKDYNNNAEERRAAAREYAHSRPEVIQQRKHDYYYRDLELSRQRGREYHVTHKEQHNASMRNRRALDPQKHRDENKQWKLNNPEKAQQMNRDGYQRNREARLQHSRVYRKNNPESARLASHRRKALRRNAQGRVTAQDIRTMKKAQRSRCYYCKAKFVNDKYHVDHVIPLSRGGSNSPENLVLACPSCNLSKHNKMPHEWTRGGRLL